MSFVLVFVFVLVLGLVLVLVFGLRLSSSTADLVVAKLRSRFVPDSFQIPSRSLPEPDLLGHQKHYKTNCFPTILASRDPETL